MDIVIVWYSGDSNWKLNVGIWNAVFQIDYHTQSSSCNISISSAVSLETVKLLLAVLSEMWTN